MNPQSFGKYQLLKKLATGGMAEVWLARQGGIEGFAKNVVVKRILPHLAEDREFVEMFKNEALIAANFNHPNIAQVYEFGEANGTYYIAMEYIHGEDLGRVMRKAWSAGQWIARPLAIRIVASACEGLYYAHTRNDDTGKPLRVVHRDISPQNILISFDGSVKLVDFGIAKAADTVGLTKSGAIKGKFAYMAPEQAAGKPLDHRADIFAIGLVLYELLTGVRPLKRDSELATLQAALECNIQTPSEVADVPSELDPVVMSALSRAADDRYRDARQFQIALEETLVAQRWVASSVQISELMETLFADRLAEEKKTGNLQPNTEDVPNSGNSSPPASPDSGSGGRVSSAVARMEWEAPPGEISQRGERVRTSAGGKSLGPRSRDSSPQRSLAEEMAEYAAPAGSTSVARRRTGDNPVPRRSMSSMPAADEARTDERPELGPIEEVPEPPPSPPPRRSSVRQPMVEDEPPSRTRARGSRASLAAELQARPEEDPYSDSEQTRLPPAQRAQDVAETLPPPAPRRRTGHVSRVSQPSVDGPSPAAMRRRTSSVQLREVPVPQPFAPSSLREELRPKELEQPGPLPSRTGEIVKKALMVLVAVAVVLLIVRYGDQFTKRAIDGREVYLSVDTVPPVKVTVQHTDKCRGDPFTELGETPLTRMGGAHLQDILILENKQQGFRVEERDLLSFGEPGETKIHKREYTKGWAKLKVTPRSAGQLTVMREGQRLGQSSTQFELWEGTHKLELHGDQLKEPVEVEVVVKPRQTTEQEVKVGDKLQK
jgi:serine/threonine protein kinase